MGQKVNPIGIRLGITRDWTSRWNAGKKQFPLHVHTDFRVREFLKDKLKEGSVSRIQLERAAKKVNIAEIRKPELDAQLVGASIAQQIEKRVMFRRAMKRAVMSTMRSGALGVKVRVSGRLNGSEIARTEWYREGRIPLHTFRADIDYGLSEAHTTYGVIGVKVWIFKGEVFDKSDLAEEAEAESAAPVAAPAAPVVAPAAAAAPAAAVAPPPPGGAPAPPPRPPDRRAARRCAGRCRRAHGTGVKA